MLLERQREKETGRVTEGEAAYCVSAAAEASDCACVYVCVAA